MLGRSNLPVIKEISACMHFLPSAEFTASSAGCIDHQRCFGSDSACMYTKIMSLALFVGMKV